MTAWIGPVRLVDAFYEPQITWTGVPTAQGLQAGVITGLAEWWQAHQLRELVNNPARRVTIGGQTGVLEPILFTDDLLGPLTAWCLLQSFQLGQADQSHSLQGTTGLVPYTITFASVGDGTHRQVVTTRSARAKPNGFGFTAQSVVVNPFWDEDPNGSAFIENPGGTRSTRTYDPSFPHSTPRATATGRAVTLYTAPFVAGADPLSLVVLPALATADGVPNWVSDRGGDVRAYNRWEEREVWGPSHHLRQCSDLLVTNGLVRFWVGNRGLVPFLNVGGFDGSTWREVGTVQFGTSAVLQGVRLVKVTPEATTVALSVQGHGDLFVTLKRGERMFRVALPNRVLRPRWSGTPPTSRAIQAANGIGHFGLGLDAGGDAATWSDPSEMWSDPRFMWDGTRVNPDIHLLWPPHQAQTAWSRVLWLRANKDSSTLTGAGYFTIYTALGVRVAQLYFDHATNTTRLNMGSTTLVSAAQSFTAGQDLMLAARFSPDAGLALSIRSPAGSVAHIKDVAATTLPGVPYDIAYLYNTSSFGDGSFGDGDFGGTTYYPNAVVDNDMLFDRYLTDAEVAALAAATTALDGLPDFEGDLVWYAPYDAVPIVALGAESSGRSVDSLTDAGGFQKAVAFLDGTHLDGAAVLVRSDAALADLQAQLAAEGTQQVRVR